MYCVCVLTVWARLFLLFRHDRSFPQEVVQAGAMTTKRVIWGHESKRQQGKIRKDEVFTALLVKGQG